MPAYSSLRFPHVQVLVLQPNDTVAKAATDNCESALRTALLMLPEGFSTVELYEAIVGLSYLGDPRMTIGENKNKIRNIVSAGRLHFDELYARPLEQLEPWLQRSGDVWKVARNVVVASLTRPIARHYAHRDTDARRASPGWSAQSNASR